MLLLVKHMVKHYLLKRCLNCQNLKNPVPDG